MHRWTIKSKVKELVEAARARAIAASHFLQQYDWDLFVVHFLATDMAQHDLWGVTQNGDEPLLEVFQGIDHLVGELSETAQHMGATVIVLSDHGMGALEWTFSINTWLLHRGYLTLRRSLLTRLRHLLFRVGLTQNALKRVGLILYPIVYRLGLGRTLFDFMENRGIGRLFSFLFLSLADVDWRNTYAYSYADIGHICLNLQGREPRGLVPERDRELLIEKLIGALEETVNPRTGEPLLGEVFRREEVYHGEHLSRAPDILFMPKDLRTVASGTWRFYSNRALDRPVMRGHHRMEGMVMAIGEPFKHAYHMKGAALVDLAPNILYLLDCPIPRYMDGKLWEDAFLPGTLTERLARWSDRPSTRDEVPRSVSKRDDEELKRRLKALGYLG
jgi:predicted AlkP superfamily phosphohydrolase/phosphomutase